ncbi:alpha/beta hydrolase fold domain-containing protein [Amycolatopsis jejuensis]|uniref:alpha/beta hydrolase fold domain-containing protein n=1 Tax=Amycolatopsis jejuensis TaxID=330084 RepID=UPI0005267BA4|nr:alpha/beta hydrolase fold domain-containing protein [Amycolatopsis jejuensis]
MSASAVPLPGRLGDPAAEYRTDPRAARPLRAALDGLGLAAPAAAPPVSRTDPLAAVVGFAKASHDGFEAVYAAVCAAEPSRDDVVRTAHTVTGRDGHEIKLSMFRPAGAEGDLPGLVYLHGGGMTILNADNGVHVRWGEDLAAEGLTVVVVDYRNAVSPDGEHRPFPTGLHDCCDAVRWISGHRAELGLSSLVLQGESGGANLCLATALTAKREGWLSGIAGVYAMVPYISGAYGWSEAEKLAELPSLVENEGWFLNTAGMDLFVAAYDPEDTERRNPVAWPYFATVEDLQGLPPHVISVNELDPLRDEGIAFYRKLQEAGVPSTGRINLGLTHGADSIFKSAVGDVYDSLIGDIARFARKF